MITMLLAFIFEIVGGLLIFYWLAGKQAQYVVFENINGKYIRKTYDADNTFIEFNNNDNPHVLVEHKIRISKGNSWLFKDEEAQYDGKDETTIVVPENTHQMKFNVE